MQKIGEDVNFDVSESIVIIGFGQMGQVKVIICFPGKVVLSGFSSSRYDFAGSGQFFVNAIGLR